MTSMAGDSVKNQISAAEMDGEQVTVGIDEKVQYEERFVIGDIVQHKVSHEKGVVESITYQNERPILYDISLGFGKLVESVPPWLLEKDVPFHPRPSVTEHY